MKQTIKDEAKEQKAGFLGTLLASLGSSLLGNLLTGKGEIATSQGREANMLGWGIIRAGQDFKCCLIL